MLSDKIRAAILDGSSADGCLTRTEDKILYKTDKITLEFGRKQKGSKFRKVTVTQFYHGSIVATRELYPFTKGDIITLDWFEAISQIGIETS